MKKRRCLSMLALAWTLAAQGADESSLAYSVRLGPAIGVYSSKNDLLTSSRDSIEVASVDDGLSIGLMSGAGVGFGRLFFDFSAESQVVSNYLEGFVRSDLVSTVAYELTDHWRAYTGFRRGLGGDDFFDDSKFVETGFFLGIGLGGTEAMNMIFSSSFAYNFSRIKYQLPEKTGSVFTEVFGDERLILSNKKLALDYPGVSIKIAAQLKKYPRHGFLLRYQAFDGSKDGTLDARNTEGEEVALTYDLKLKEGYTQLAYIYSFID